jgi:DNA polymerase kappa
MERGGWSGRTVTLKYKLDTYEVFTRAKSFNRWIRTKSDLYDAGAELLQHEWPLRLRLIGLRVTKLKDLRKKDDSITKVRIPPPFATAPAQRLDALFFQFLERLPDSPSKKNRIHDHDIDEQGSDAEFSEPHPEDYLDSDPSDGEGAPVPTAELPPQASTSKPFETTSALPALELPSPPRRPSKLPGPSSTTRVAVPLEQDAVSYLHVRDERIASEAQARSEPAGVPQISSTIVVSECPLCMRPFEDNDELNAHIDWCLSREAIRSAQGESGRSEQRKPEGGVRDRDLTEWWKAGAAEERLQTRKAKRRKMNG